MKTFLTQIRPFSSQRVHMSGPRVCRKEGRLTFFTQRRTCTHRSVPPFSASINVSTFIPSCMVYSHVVFFCTVLIDCLPFTNLPSFCMVLIGYCLCLPFPYLSFTYLADCLPFACSRWPVAFLLHQINMYPPHQSFFGLRKFPYLRAF